MGRINAAALFRRILLSWLIAVTAEYLLLPGTLRNLAGLEGLAEMSLLRVIGITFGVTVLLWILSRSLHLAKAERWGMVIAFGILAIAALWACFTWAFFGACTLIGILLAVFAVRGWNGSPERVLAPQRSGKAWPWITAGLSGVFFLFVSAWGVGRVYSFSTPSYDFGIFCQMFYNMKHSGLPMTTLERDGLLSHFAVHVSPVYYLLLPFYALVPKPATLQVLQAAVITSAAIPLWKIGKRHGFSGGQRTLLCAILLLYPAFSGGTGYDIHENCFLTPLLLWLLYGIDRKNTAVTAVAAILTLTVKEDAAVYVAVTGLWLVVRTVLRFEKKERKALLTGLALLAVSLGWFFGVTGYLANSGDGVMTYRYGNFLYDGSSSLLTVVKSVLLCPMKALYECVDAEKLPFLALTLLPLLGLPLLTRRYERFLLLIPYILVNLMSDYRYQHDIFFQYTFGSAAFLIYLTAVNLADLSSSRPRVLALILTAAVSGACFGKTVVPTAVYYPTQAVRSFDHYQEVRDTLSLIPEDASVAATTFYTTELSQRETLYDVRYTSQSHLLECQYVILGVSSGGDYAKYATGEVDNGFENLVDLLRENRYSPFAEVKNTLIVYCRPEQPE